MEVADSFGRISELYEIHNPLGVVAFSALSPFFLNAMVDHECPHLTHPMRLYVTKAAVLKWILVGPRVHAKVQKPCCIKRDQRGADIGVMETDPGHNQREKQKSIHPVPEAEPEGIQVRSLQRIPNWVLAPLL